jgi:putative ABC transport system permease protein
VNLFESARFAWQGVTANKARSALTMLGVLIGVASVIVLVAVGQGASALVTKTFSALGTNTLTVTSNSSEFGARRGVFRPGGGNGGDSAQGVTTDTGTKSHVPELTLEDARAMANPATVPDVLGVAPFVSPNSVTATFQGASHSVGSTIGSTSAYLTINNDSVQAGREFSDSDYIAHSRVVLLGVTVAKELAGGDGESILDQTVELNGKSFDVIGILTVKGSTGPLDQDDRIIAPATAVQDTLSGYQSLSSIAIKATAAGTVDAAQSEVELLLDERHGTTADNRDFTVFNSAAFLSAATSVTQIFTVLLGAIAGISLFVGGIGVMNIMLVTVTERTREIGIRKAIGAGRGVIIAQFLIEAVMLSTFGGLLGVAVGVSLCQISVAGFSPVVQTYSVIVAFSFAVAVGLFFGLYPARRAASLRPIDALRYE